MLTMFLSYLLSLLMLFTPAPYAAQEAAVRPAPLFWGMIDPDLSLWFSRTPFEAHPGRKIMWDFSWRGFLAALTGQPILTEVPHAPLS